MLRPDTKEPSLEDGCCLCGKKPKNPGRDLVTTFAGDNSLYVCRPCYKEIQSAFRTLINGRRAQFGLPPLIFRSYVR